MRRTGRRSKSAPTQPAPSRYDLLGSRPGRLIWGGILMPEWIGSIVFVVAVGLSGAKIAEDFGHRGLRGYAVLMITLMVYASAVALAFT